MWRLDRFGIDDLETCSPALRAVGQDAESMADVAQRMVELLHQGLQTGAGTPACALVRYYATQSLGALDDERRAFALAADPDLDEATRCLTLLGTAGVEPAWCDPAASRGHLAIPLGSAEALRSLPMVSALFTQLGFSPEEVVDPDAGRALQLHHRAYDVFHVPDAAGSPWVPAQEDFVAAYGVRSVLGLGGALPTGDLFAMLLFATVPLTDATARMLQPLAAAIKAAVVPFSFRVFS